MFEDFYHDLENITEVTTFRKAKVLGCSVAVDLYHQTGMRPEEFEHYLSRTATNHLSKAIEDEIRKALRKDENSCVFVSSSECPMTRANEYKFKIGICTADHEEIIQLTKMPKPIKPEKDRNFIQNMAVKLFRLV